MGCYITNPKCLIHKKLIRNSQEIPLIRAQGPNPPIFFGGGGGGRGVSTKSLRICTQDWEFDSTMMNLLPMVGAKERAHLMASTSA